MSRTPTNTASFEDVWAVLKQVSLMQKEAEQEIKELRSGQKKSKEDFDLQMRKSKEDFDLQMKKSKEDFDLQMKKSKEDFKREMRERDEKMDRMFKKTDLHIQKIGGRFDTKWGYFVESLVEGNLIKILRSRGVDVDQVFLNIRKEIETPHGFQIEKEYDLIAANGSEVVVVEVKTTLTAQDVKDFLEEGLSEFKKYFPIYKNHILYGAIGYLKTRRKAQVLAEEKGLFVIRAAGGSGVCINKAGFKPKAFS